MKVVDGDAHFIEPLDMFKRYVDPAYRDRAMRVETDSISGNKKFLVDGKPMQILDVEAFLGAVVGYGQKEQGQDLGSFDRYHYYSAEWDDTGQRIRY